MNPDMFRHMWFMSVLMQFYLLVPIAVYVLLKSLHRWIPVFVLTGLAICSALSMGLRYHIDDDPTRVYFGSDTHAMGLWLGAAFAWALMLTQARQRPCLRNTADGPYSRTLGTDRSDCRIRSVIGVAVDDASYRSRSHVFPLRHCVGFDTVRSIDSRLHSLRIMDEGLAGVQTACHDRPLGIPYGIYLWHWPLWLLVRAVFPQWGARRPPIVHWR